MSNKRIVRGVLHWAASRGHYAVTARRRALIGRASHHGRSLARVSPTLQRPAPFSIPPASPALLLYAKSSRVKQFETRFTFPRDQVTFRDFLCRSIKLFHGFFYFFKKSGSEFSGYLLIGMIYGIGITRDTEVKWKKLINIRGINCSNRCYYYSLTVWKIVFDFCTWKVRYV